MKHAHQLRNIYRGTFLWVLCALFVSMLPHASAATPATRPAAPTAVTAGAIVVNSTNGSANDNSNSTCTLLEAIQAANDGNSNYQGCTNGSSGPDLINFTVSGPIVLQATANINTNIAMVGPGPVVISGGGQNRIFKVTGSNATLSLGPLMTLQDGATSGSGAAIWLTSGATVNIAGVSFINNVSSGGNGGAIFNEGSTLNIAGGNFLNNRSTDTNNGNGGAISSSATADTTITGSNFDANMATNSGGAIHNLSPNTLIADSVFGGNTAVGGTNPSGDPQKGGGALANFQNGTLRVVRTAFTGNSTAQGYGGVLYNTIQATANITSSSFYNNVSGSPAADGRGGAIYTMGPLTVDKSAFIANAALGHGGALGIDRPSTINIYNSSFTANTATKTGGALIVQNTQQGGNAPTVTAINSTFYDNSASGNAPSGGAIFNGHAASAVTLKNTIVANSSGGNCNTLLTSQGNNLDSEMSGSATACVNGNASDVQGQDPLLDSLAFNGGPIASLLTQKLLAGSPAIDKGDPTACASAQIGNKDQRGNDRPEDGDGNGSAICDIGAFESETLMAGYSSTPPAPGPLDFGNVQVNTAADTTLSIAETGNAKLVVSNPVFGGANAGDFQIAAGQMLPLQIADGAAAQDLKLTCTPAALGNRTATLTLSTNDPNHASVTYNLSCKGVSAPTPGFGSNPIAPGPLSWGDATIGVQKDLTLNILETGTADLSIDSATLGGDNPGDFAIVTAMPLNITNTAGGNSAPLMLRCTPTVLGVRTATLTLTTNDDPDHSSVTFTLTCNGIAPVPPILTPGGTATGLTPTLDGTYDVAVSPDGKFVYATGYASDSISVFSRDASGALTPVETRTDSSYLDGAGFVMVTPDGKNVLVAARLANKLTNFERDPVTGKLSLQDTIVEGNQYACNSGFCTLDGLDGINSLAVSPDGKYVYISASNDNALVVLKRNITTGALSSFITGPIVVQVVKAVDINADPTLQSVRGIALSPDGKTLYTTAFSSDTVAVYGRDGATGMLTFQSKLVQGQATPSGSVDGLNMVRDVIVSPNGAHVYVVATDVVASFARDPLSGNLTWLQALHAATDGIPALNVPSSLAISPDGLQVYVSAYGSILGGKAVVAFDREVSSGLLTHRQSIVRTPSSGAGGVPPLDGARGIALSPDGSNVYVAAYLDDRLVWLNRANPAPLIASISPASVFAGGPAFALDIYGEGFLADGNSVVMVGASSYTSPEFINSTHLRISVAASDITSVGTRQVKVINAAPGGGTSNIVELSVLLNTDNPVPAISSVSPNTVTATGPAFMLEIYGAGFIDSSVARWNGSDRPTTFVSSTHLRAAIDAADIAVPGTASITVRNPAPGGGLSNAARVAVLPADQNAVPAILELRPKSITTFLTHIPDERTLDILGNNFIAESVVYWNGTPRTTTYIDQSHLQVTISPTDQISAGSYPITVVNPAPGGGASNEEIFTTSVIQVVARTFIPVLMR